MRKGTSILGVTVIGLAMASACSDDSSTDLDEKTTAGGAHVVRATSGALTPPSTAAPSAIAKHFVADRTGVADQQLVIAAEIPGRNGVTHVRLTQLVDGLRVAGAYAKVAISDRGEVIQSIDKLAAVAGAPIAARIDEHAALAAAISALGYRAAMTYHQAPTVERVAYLADDGLHVGFEVMTWTETGNRLNYTVVGGDGSIVSVEDRTQHDAYNVYAEDPLKGGQAVVNGPGGNGWLGAGSQSTTNITGNNAHAYLDRDANNAPDTGGTAVADGNFLTAANLGAAPTTAGNQSVAVQNLFYFNNTIHDILYSHGFNEAAGNFQTNNFGNGGAGNDAVNAEAQDGSGTDNANFSTPADGSAPRMQMYLWTGSAPDAFVSVNGTDYGAFGSAFGPAVTTAGVAGPLAVYRDASGDTNDACEASTTSLTGKVAIVNRGTCNFTVKVLNAQNAGAIAVVIANNAPGPASTPGGTERKIKIPSGEVTQADGATLKTLAGASGRLRKSNLVALQIDGDIDADIVFHEYGHGLSWRMIGGMSGPLAGAIGEGASDVNAFLVNGDDRIGEYAFSNPIGVRRAPYQDYALTYSSVTGAEVHNDGEIYAAAMWKVFQNYLAAGLTASDLQDDFVDGMNFTPVTPADEDMRDGMLQGLPAGSPRACLIWRGFAAQGIGVGADGRLGHHNAVIITESFAVPAGC